MLKRRTRAVRPESNNAKFRWDNNVIPYELSTEFSVKRYEKIMSVIEDVNLNLEGCLKFRYSKIYYSRVM